MKTYPKELVRSLTVEEERDLWDRWAATSDPKVRDRIVMSVYRLCVREAHRCANYVPLEDRINAGIVGALRAFKKFEPERGNRFTTYAAPWIRDAIWSLVGRNRTIVSATKIRGGAANAAGDAHRKALTIESLDATDTSLNGKAGYERYSAEDCLTYEPSERETLHRDFAHLPELFEKAGLSDVEKTIIERRWLGTRGKISLRTLEQQLGLSREAIRLKEKAAFAKVRKALGQ